MDIQKALNPTTDSNTADEIKAVSSDDTVSNKTETQNTVNDIQAIQNTINQETVESFSLESNADNHDKTLAQTVVSTKVPEHATAQVSIENTTKENAPHQIDTNNTLSTASTDINDSVSEQIHRDDNFDKTLSQADTSDELSIVIKALEQKKIVKSIHAGDSTYTKKLSDVIYDKEQISAPSVQPASLETSASFKEAFNSSADMSTQHHIEIINDVSTYLDALNKRKDQYLEAGTNTDNASSSYSSIEGISEIISDMSNSSSSRATNSSSDMKAAIAKLPSFGPNGEIIPASSTVDTNQTPPVQTKIEPTPTTVTQNVTPVDEVPFDVNPIDTKILATAIPTAKDDSSVSQSAQDSTLNSTFNKPIEKPISSTSEIEKIVGDITNPVSPITDNQTPIEEQEFTLEPIAEELSADEMLKQAQEAALAQLNANETLNKQLQEEAKVINAKLSSTINETLQSSDETTNNQTKDTQDIQAIDSNLIEEKSFNIEEDSSLNIDTNESTDTNLSANADTESTESTVSTQESIETPLITETASNASVQTETVTSLNEPVAVESQNNDGNSIDLYYQKGLFEGNIEEVAYKVKTQMPSLKDVMNEVDALTPDAPQNLTDVKQAPEDILTGDLLHAVDNALNGVYGENVNFADGDNTIKSPANASKTVRATIENQNIGVMVEKTHAKTVSNTTAQVSDENSIDDVNESIDTYTETVDVNSYDYADTNSQSQSQNVVSDEDSNEDELSEPVMVSGSDFHSVRDDSNEQKSSDLMDGNPKNLRSSALKLIEEDQQFENKRLGRKLEPKDFYYKVKESDPWFQIILKCYNNGPVFSSLCYSQRTINPSDEYDWTLEVSDDFGLLIQSPDFHHNLRTKFSIAMNHPIELKIVSVHGLPRHSPESLANQWYLKEIEDARMKIATNKNLNTLLEHLGEDVRTMNISLYTQLELPNKS